MFFPYWMQVTGQHFSECKDPVSQERNLRVIHVFCEFVKVNKVTYQSKNEKFITAECIG